MALTWYAKNGVGFINILRLTCTHSTVQRIYNFQFSSANMNFQWWCYAFEPQKAVDHLLSEEYKTFRRVNVKEVWGWLGTGTSSSGKWPCSQARWCPVSLQTMLSDPWVNSCPVWAPWSSRVPYTWGYPLILWTDHCCFGLYVQTKSHKHRVQLLMTHQITQTRQGQNTKKQPTYQQRKRSKNTPNKSWNHTKVEITSWGIFVNY